MTTPNYPTVWYWVVQDTNPTTKVWESSSGAFVANTAANYLSWVANGGRSFQFTPQHPISNAANNGSGLIRVTTDNTAEFTTGDAWVIQSVGGTTEANGTWLVTVIDSTHLDLQGSAFVHTFTSAGVIDRGSIMDTAVDMYAAIDSYNQSLTPNLYLALSMSSGHNLLNPMATWLDVTPSVGALTLVLPQMNLFGGIPKGKQFFIHNASAGFSLIVDSFSGTSFGFVDGQDVVIFTLTDNSTTGGTFAVEFLPAVLSVEGGGTGDTTLTNHSVLLGGATVGFATIGTAGRLLIDQGASADPAFEAMSGDATITSAGAITVNKVKGNNPIAVADGGTGAAKYNACRIYLNSSQTGIASGAWVKVNLDTVDFDPDSIADVATNHRITPNTAGTYQVAAAVDGGASTNLTAVFIGIAKNGSRVSVVQAQNVPAGAAEIGSGMSDLVQMNGTTDYLELNWFPIANAGGTGTANAGKTATRLSCVRVGP